MERESYKETINRFPWPRFCGKCGTALEKRIAYGPNAKFDIFTGKPTSQDFVEEVLYCAQDESHGTWVRNGNDTFWHRE